MNPDHLPHELPEPSPALRAVTEERRASQREERRSPLRLTIDSLSMEGVTENLSGVGVLFFSEASLRVSVEMEENGQKRVRRGRLVRVQRMSLENTGFAVEFDPE